jgi:hypothetical protein
VPVELALRQRHGVLGADLHLFVPERVGCLAVGDILQLEQDVTGLDARGLNDVRLAVNEHAIAAAEALLREIRDDTALQLAADTVRRKHLGDDQELGRPADARRRRGRLGCLCAWRRL